MLTAKLLSGAAALALTVGSLLPITASASSLTARGGSLDAFGGSLDAFGGSLDAFGGSLDAFGGSLDAFGGQVEVSGGSLDAFGGSLDAFGGSLDAFGGSLDAFGGSLYASKGGSLDAFGGSLDAFGGSLDAFGGSLDAFGGSLDAFSGGSLDAFGGSLDAFGGSLDAFGGSLDAFGGSLDAFGGSLDAFALFAFGGSLDAFGGSLDAFGGSLDAFAGGSLDAFGGSLDAFGGSLDAFGGSLDAFAGGAVVDPFWGTVSTRGGSLDAFGGSLDAFGGSLDAFGGSLDAFGGSLDAFGGSLDAFGGSLDAFGGSILVLGGSLDAFGGSLDAFEGSLDAFGGSLDAFAGGSLDAFGGSLDAFGGSLDAFGGGSLDAFGGSLDAFGGSLDAFAHFVEVSGGSLDAFANALSAYDGDLTALGGSLDTFGGSLDAFGGSLDAFAGGSLDAFGGSLDAFGGSLDAFGGSLDAFGGSLDAFGDLAAPIQAVVEAFGGSLDAFSGSSTSEAAALRALGGSLYAFRQLIEARVAYDTVLASAESAFAPLISAQTGLDFESGFLSDFLGTHGLEGDGFVDFLELSASDQRSVLIDMSDQLRTFIGIDHVDHWMGAADWSPLVSAISGGGQGVRTGFVDMAFDGEGGLAFAPTTTGGVFEDQTHGLAVTSLFGAVHDGSGVMGVAPGAEVFVSNPFDVTNTTSWDDTASSILSLASNDVSIINLSLGEPGQVFAQGWMDVFGRQDIQALGEASLFVMAAGNTGDVQSVDVDFGTNQLVNNIILVGSIDQRGEISSFSNTPGDACFTTDAGCTAIAERFLVAPGEELLVSTPDGIGRVTGTSFATPLVTGAAALLQSRWGWLADNPDATAEILFRSAKDLGERGVDEVYGWGLLDIEASQLPLSFTDLTVNTHAGQVPLTSIGFTRGLARRLDSQATITVFEEVGSTYRDFTVPISMLTATEFNSEVTAQNDAERIFATRIGGNVGSGARVSGLAFNGTHGFSDTAVLSSSTIGHKDAAWALSMVSREQSSERTLSPRGLSFQTEARLTNSGTGMEITLGHGEGGLALQATDAISLTSDIDIRTGGTNPILGLASGGTYFGAAIPVSGRVSFLGGYSERRQVDLVADPISGILRERFAGAETYEAEAFTVGARYAFTGGTHISAQMTQLDETDGIFGEQALGGLGFGEVMRSQATTVTFNSALPRGFAITASATSATTDGAGNMQGALSVDGDVIRSSSFQFAGAKTGVFSGQDRLRLSVAQPLHVEEGSLALTSQQVVNRQTGELGLVTEALGIDNDLRRFVGEMIYAAPVFEGRGMISAFTVVDSNPVWSAGDTTAVTTGASFTIRF